MYPSSIQFVCWYLNILHLSITVCMHTGNFTDILISVCLFYKIKKNKTNGTRTLVVGTSDVLIQSSECFHWCKLHEERGLVSWNPFHWAVVTDLRDTFKQWSGFFLFFKFLAHEQWKNVPLLIRNTHLICLSPTNRIKEQTLLCFSAEWQLRGVSVEKGKRWKGIGLLHSITLLYLLINHLHILLLPLVFL